MVYCWYDGEKLMRLRCAILLDLVDTCICGVLYSSTECYINSTKPEKLHVNPLPARTPRAIIIIISTITMKLPWCQNRNTQKCSVISSATVVCLLNCLLNCKTNEILWTILNVVRLLIDIENARKEISIK